MDTFFKSLFFHLIENKSISFFSFLSVCSLQKKKNVFETLCSNFFVHRSEADDCNFFLVCFTNFKLIETFMHWMHNEIIKMHLIALEMYHSGSN